MDGKQTVLSAFTGAGGMDIGLEAAGFNSVGCIESDGDARETIKKNRDWRLLEPGDIVELAKVLQPNDLGMKRGELTLIAAGPPCQPFSAAAQWAASGRRGLADQTRAAALFAFFDIVRTLLPRAVVIENVPGFIRGQGSALGWIEDWAARLSASGEASYGLFTRVLNAADYGVPQNRRRAVIVLLRDSARFGWPTITHGEGPIRTWDALRSIDLANPPMASGEWADLLPSIPEGANYIWHTDRGGGLPLFGYRTRYWSFLLKLAKAKPSWTISAQSGPSSGPFHWDSRPLAIEEMAALQTFPRSWVFAGSDRSMRRQIGNATPSLLAEVVGRSVAGWIDGRQYDAAPTLSIAPARSVPAPAPPQEVPPRYLKLIADHPAHPGAGLGPAPSSAHAARPMK